MPARILLSILAIIGLHLLQACAADQTYVEVNRTFPAPKPAAEKLCTDPRPELCTQEYLPVCARLQNGQQKSYSNGCTACSDPDVVGYRQEDCLKRK